jgi:hypothetical protein
MRVSTAGVGERREGRRCRANLATPVAYQTTRR